MRDVNAEIDTLVKSNPVVLFMKGTPSFPMCGFSARTAEILKACGMQVSQIKSVNVLEDPDIREGVKQYGNWPTIPQLYINKELVGGSDIMMEMFESGELKDLLAK
jgi:monothiol glutaredoxin